MDLTKSQELVINTKNKSLLVSASAGSGKTFVVVERIVKEIEQGENINNLMALTFTNAAAFELKERITKKLVDLKNKYVEAKDIENAKRITKQISYIPSSDISTIHAFCLNIIRNNFFVLGIDPNVVTLDETTSSIMLQESILQVIEEEYELAKIEFLDLIEVYGKEEVLIEQLTKIYHSYKNMVDGASWLTDSCKQYNVNVDTSDLTDIQLGGILVNNIHNRLKLIKLELEKTIEDIEGLEDFASRKSVLEQILKNINCALSIDTYDGLYNYMPILVSTKALPSGTVLDEELRDHVKKIKNKVAAELKKLQLIAYKDTKGIVVELNETYKYVCWLKEAVIKIDEVYTKKKLEKSGVDFSDYEHLALKVLQDENIRKTYINKYSKIYIDEYQDTSLIQEKIISKISKENNVVMVGDVKQSIYGFRNAKPQLFMEKFSQFKEVLDENSSNAKIILSENFRSRKQVIDSINQVFSPIMSTAFGGANYDDREALVYGANFDTDGEEKYKTELHIVETKETEQETIDNEIDDSIKDMTNLHKEAYAVAKRIKELTDNLMLYDTKKEILRKCEYRDIVILLRSVENKANIVSDVLMDSGIPTYSDTSSGFYKSDEISLVISFLKVLDNIYDDISLSSIMYSIIGKFTLDELVEIRAKDTNISMIESIYSKIETLEDGTLKDKIKDFLNLLEQFRLYLKTYSLSELVIKLYTNTGMYEAMKMENLGELKCANLDAFVKIVDEYEKNELSSSLYSLISYINSLKSKESAGDSPKLLGENENVVRIMTMHKSKGLEFPVVIIMGTASLYNITDLKEKILTDEKLGLGVDIINKDIGITYPSVIKLVIKEKVKRTLYEEAMRLLYVAMTRAKEKLIIYGTVSSLEGVTKDLIQDGNDKVSQVIVSNLNSHLKLLLQSLVLKEQTTVDIEVINAPDNLATVRKTEKQKIDREKSVVQEFEKIIKENNIVLNKDLKENFAQSVKNVYGYLRSINVEQKYTATELKKFGSNETLDLSILKPDAINNTIDSMNYGTFIHEIIEKMDITKVSYDMLCDLVRIKATEEGIEEKINITKVSESIYSMYLNLKSIFDEAMDIKRELEFVIRDDLNKIPELALQDKTLIQGVIDMIIVTKNNEYIIIDFKTDKIEKEEDLKDRYKYQLLIYKRAVEIIYNVDSPKMYIYSFSLKKLIEI